LGSRATIALTRTKKILGQEKKNFFTRKEGLADILYILGTLSMKSVIRRLLKSVS